MSTKHIKDVLFVVQARVSSQRVPRKMIRPFGRTSLLNICLKKIVESNIPNENFILSANEIQLKRLAEHHGLNVYDRSVKSANEEKDLMSLYEWHDKYPQYKYIVLINACNLFLSVDTINDFIDTYLNSPNDGLFAVTNKKNYFWNSDGDLITPWPEGYELMNTKAVQPTYEASHCLYASRLDLISKGNFMGKAPFTKDAPEVYVIDEFESLDVDYEWQFSLYTSYWEKLNG
jgi:CMP-N-acetylneuraminic acid synthetase